MSKKRPKMGIFAFNRVLLMQNSKKKLYERALYKQNPCSKNGCVTSLQYIRYEAKSDVTATNQNKAAITITLQSVVVVVVVIRKGTATAVSR